MGSSGSKAVGGIASNAAKRYNQQPSVRNAPPPSQHHHRDGVVEAEGEGRAVEQRHVSEESASLPSWYKQSSYDVLRSHSVKESPGLTINRKPVSEAEMDSVSNKDASFVQSLHKISHIVQKESMSNVMPSMEELRRRRGTAAGVRAQPLPQNRRKLVRSIDDIVGNGDEKLFTVPQLKLAMMGGDLGHSAPHHDLSLQIWQNVCKFISLPLSELHTAQSRANRTKVRIGQRSTQ
eukprot:TRINITY_DN4114_c0_g1_i1.p1 TRINITY_DN4114_c0_g1~~TRINITY_DN4114_c0_g1_i1.p1  ORF type:complete len:235 (+),score=41.91 TRINITY_DN4114_c0_g1_i1:152-856(+)